MADLIFCLMGPTASGKTDLACELVRKFPFEIISVDSAMIYREMNIGTAKPAHEILTQAPHHLIDILDPCEIYSAALFCEDVQRICNSVIERGKLPLLVGGTMMYFRALQQGLSSLPKAAPEIRKKLLEEAQARGWSYLHERLTQVDPQSAARIHPHDTQRIQRALEVYEMAAMPLSKFLNDPALVSGYRFINLMLMPEQRRWLHDRIALRFEQMLLGGLVEEVEQLIKKWQLTPDYPSMKSVGYRQVLAYLQGEYDYETLLDKGMAATRQLAKRQLTWLRHWPEGYAFTAENSAVLGEIVAIIQKILDN